MSALDLYSGLAHPRGAHHAPAPVPAPASLLAVAEAAHGRLLALADSERGARKPGLDQASFEAALRIAYSDRLRAHGALVDLAVAAIGHDEPPVALEDLARRVFHGLLEPAEIEDAAERLLTWARTAEPSGGDHG